MIALLAVVISLALTCLWLLWRARAAEEDARSARQDADATFDLWCHAAHDRDRFKAIVKWLHEGHDARSRRSAG